MKKFIIVVLVLMLIFAVIRITTSTYENIKRGNNVQMMEGKIYDREKEI